MNDTGLTIRRLLSIVRRRLGWLIVGGLIGLIGAAIFSTLLYTPSYTSSALVYLSATPQTGDASSASPAKSNSILSSGEMAAGRSAVSTCAVILKSNKVLEEVIAVGNLSLTPRQLAGCFAVAPENNTEVMRITVTTNDPVFSEKLCNMLAKQTTEIMLNVIRGGEAIPLGEASPAVSSSYMRQVVKYSVFGLFGGVAAVFAATLVLSICGTRIKNPEDLLRVTGHKPVGVVPLLSKKEPSPAGIIPQKLRKPIGDLCAILSTRITHENKMILCGSIHSGEGSSFITDLLAIEFASTHSKVLLIDVGGNSDFSYKSLLYAPQRQTERTEAGQTDTDAPAARETNRSGPQITQYNNLYYLSADQYGEPLDDDVFPFRDLYDRIIEVEPDYGLILLNMPALENSSLALRFTPLVAGVLLVIRQNTTRFETLQHTMNQISQANGKILGTVLNAFQSRKAY